MSKGGGGGGAPAPKEDKGPNNFKTGISPYPSNGQFPILPQQNFWQGGNFMMPGVSQPLMQTDLLSRFPQLAAIFGGKDPNTAPSNGAPNMYGFAPTFGSLTPNPGSTTSTKLTKKQQREADREARRNA
jgi:hypothetical protein